MAKTDRSVVRNQSYQKKAIGIRERHNERKNESYSNPDIVKDRSYLNIHFKQCECTYAQTFDKMQKEGIISTRGLKPDAKMFDEMVFDVNTAYFERHGGYEYAKRFFEETYRLAVKEAGGEQYILSAVMHADERNKALSEQIGRDVFHYHMHVVYIPVVEKAIKWSKRCKDKNLVGKTREVIHQVSHSKKWKSEKALDEHGKILRREDGKPILISSYSLLQDRFFEHMRVAGFRDFERGQRASTIEHISVAEYKAQKEEQKALSLHKKVIAMDKYLSELEKRSAAVKSSSQQINSMAHPTLIGSKITLEATDWNKVKALAKETLILRGRTSDLEHRFKAAKQEIQRLNQQQTPSTFRLIEETQDYQRAKQYAPERVKAFVAGILAEVRNKTCQRSIERQQSRRRDTR